MKKQFKFKRCNCVITYQPTHRQRTMVNEQKNAKSQKKLATAIKDDSDRSNSSDTKRDQSNHKSRVTKGIHALSKNRESIDTVQELPEKIMPDVYRR